jgi:acetolactate synthase-1/2/3 large subunit
MGYGVPSGVAAGIRHRKRIVVSFSGDGCFQMNGQEIGTAVQQGVKVIFIVVNNRMYGTIRMHQENYYPKRRSGTDLVNPDFAALARAYGAHGETVKKTEDFEAAFERCRSVDGPSLIELLIDQDAVLPTTTLSAIQAEALKS